MDCREILWITVVIALLLTHSTAIRIRYRRQPLWRTTYTPPFTNWWFNTWPTPKPISPISTPPVPALNQNGPNGYSSAPQYCGVSPIDPFSDRIVGGVEVVPHEYPWQVKLFHDNSFHCGAALISDRHLLTAGHCVTAHLDGTSNQPRSIRGNVMNYEVKSPGDYIAELGAHKMNENYKNVVQRKVLNIMVNPDYDIFASDYIMLQTNDIAIAVIKPVAFSNFIAPICLPVTNAKVPDGTKLTVAGWGSTLTETLETPTTKLPENLMKAVLTKISYKSCQKNRFVGRHLNQINQMGDREIFCLIGKNQDTCRGDSGGPATVRTPQGFVVAGLVSWGLGCNQKEYPAAYTQVSSYMDFILQNTRDGKFLPHSP